MKSQLRTSPISFLGKRIFALLTICSIASNHLRAQWSTDPTVNNPIAIAAMGDYKNEPRIISDGVGGAIIVWYDNRNGIFNSDVFVQRINSAGVIQWTVNGATVSTAPGDQYLPALVSDGAGGAIIAWQDFRNGTSNPDVYAQRINASGATQWTANGVVISAAANEQYAPNISSDGAGGAIITWQDARNSSNADIYAQRINSSGAVQWTNDGVVICAAANSQSSPEIVSDGSNGAIITWQDYRGGVGNGSDVYAQRIDASGNVQWAADGVAISTTTNDQVSPTLVSDNANGAIITWQDFRSGISDIYAQRINNGGAVQWAANGIAVCTASSFQYTPIIVSDGSNGAIVTWHDFRNSQLDIYVQRINSSGVPQWNADGILIKNSPEVPAIITDGAGGAIITWQDQRNGTSNGDIFAQRINATGSIQWIANGAAIGTSNVRDEYKPRLTSDGANGAIITWKGYDTGYTKTDIFAQKVNANGTLDGGNPNPNPCPTLLTLVSTADDYSSGSVTKQAAASNGKIEASNLITSNANVTYEAKSIELKPGFRADNGTVFKAQVGGCGGQ